METSKDPEEGNERNAAAGAKAERKRESFFVPNECLLGSLLEMGIGSNAARKALYYTGNTDLVKATNWIFDGIEKDLETPLEDELDTKISNSYCRRNKSCEDSYEESSDEDGPNFKMVFVVNSSLGMTCGKISAQVGHATLGIYRQIHQSSEESGVKMKELSMWEEFGERMVTLNGENSEQLRGFVDVANSLQLPNFLVQDAGLTQVNYGAETVFAVFGEESKINIVTGKLKLLP